jgi:nucleotide-binding universal stress UspA family protein
MERIVIGIDTEAASQVAVDWVIRRLQREPASIRLVKAFDMLIDAPLRDAEMLARTKARIEDAAPGADVETKLIDGSIMEALVGQSASADLVVLGYHRRHPLLSALSGALPVRFAARSHCATVIVPEDWEAREGDVVLGVGDDEAADTATEFAVREAQHPRRALELVHAWQLPTPSWDAVGALIASADDLHDAHRDILGRVGDRLREAHPALDIRESLAQGPTTPALLDAARDAELIVLGTHRRGPVSGLILGSTAFDLLPQSRVPVCIVPLLAPLAPASGVLSTFAAA